MNRFRWISNLLVSAALLAGAARAAEPILSLPATAAPGQSITFAVVWTNESGAPMALDGPSTAVATVWVGGSAHAVAAQRLDGASKQVPASGFASEQWRLALPTAVEGPVVVEVPVAPGLVARGGLIVASTTGASTGARSVSAAKAEPTPQTTVLSTLQRGYMERFGAHESTYFIYGPDAPAAKFQFSFKYRLMQREMAATDTVERTVQFGYTQRSLWDIDAESSPFYDTSYMPSLFVEWLPVQKGPKTAFQWVSGQVGFQHESNGRGEADSRSLNTLFARAAATWNVTDNWSLIAVPRVYGYVGGLSDNPELKDYRGYGDLMLVAIYREGAALAYTGRAGKDFDHFSTQLDLTIPLRSRLLDFATYAMVQYFNGYGESLRSYKDHSETIRLGISLVR